MDFRNRNDLAGRVATPAAPTTPSVASAAKEKKNHFKEGPGWLRVMYIALLFSITVLCLSVAYFLSVYNPNESRYAFTEKYQAVFLSNGQVYFGKLHSINGRYADLRNIYYLNSNSSSASNSQSQAQSDKTNQFTLVKLGCELHGPYDQMIINHGDITFWENLRDDSQVVKTIKQWQKQNPDGQTCTTTSSSTNQSTGTGTQSTATGAAATGTSTTSTSSTSDTTKKQ